MGGIGEIERERGRVRLRFGGCRIANAIIERPFDVTEDVLCRLHVVNGGIGEIFREFKDNKNARIPMYMGR